MWARPAEEKSDDHDQDSLGKDLLHMWAWSSEDYLSISADDPCKKPWGRERQDISSSNTKSLGDTWPPHPQTNQKAMTALIASKAALGMGGMKGDGCSNREPHMLHP